MENLERLNNKNILVTGGTGFIGGHLVEELLQAGASVVVPYIQIDPRSLFKTHNLQDRVSVRKLNIVNYSELSSFIKEKEIDYIFHLAAQTLVTEAYDDPYTTLETNIMGTVNILESVRKLSSVKGVIVASSDKAYGKTKKAYTEDSPLSGDHPYDVSKSSADLIAHMYYKTYNLPVVVTRFGNVYGEGDLHFDRIIPGICKAIITQQPLMIRSDGSYVRDYLYVKDVARGYVHLLNQLQNTKGQAYNFSSEESLSVLELIKKIENTINIKIPFKILNTAINEIPYQHLDDSKIRNTGWETKYTLDITFPEILAWYKQIF